MSKGRDVEMALREFHVRYCRGRFGTTSDDDPTEFQRAYFRGGYELGLHDKDQRSETVDLAPGSKVRFDIYREPFSKSPIDALVGEESLKAWREDEEK